MKKSLLYLVMVLGLVFLLAACSDSDDTSSSDDSSSDDTTTETSDDSGDTEAEADDSEDLGDVDLRMVTMFGEGDPAADVLKSQLEAFQDEHPGVTIEHEGITSDGGQFRTKVQTDFSSGNEPDVTFYFTGSDASNMISEELVHPMDDILAEDTDWSGAFNEAALEQVRADDGNIYAIPLTGFYEGLIVNKTLFDEYDLELPTDWDKFTTAIDTFADNDIVPIAASLGKTPHYLIEHFILAEGGPEGHNATFADGVNDSWIDGLNLIKDLAAKGAFPADASTIDDEFAQNIYKNSEAAMMINGSWATGWDTEEHPELQGIADNSVVLPMPVPDDGAATYGDIIAGFTSGYYISEKAYQDDAKQKAVVALTKYLTSEESIQAIATANGGTPSIPVDIEGLNAAQESGLELVGDANSFSLPIDAQINPDAWTEIYTNVDGIVSGDKDPADVLEQAKELQDKGE